MDTSLFTGIEYKPFSDFWKYNLPYYSDGFCFRQKKKSSDQRKVRIDAFVVEAKTAELLFEICGDNDTAIFVCLTSVLAILLKKYTGSNAVIISSPFFDNGNSETVSKQNIVPLLFNLEHEGAIKTFLNNSQQLIKECYKYQDYPISQLISSDESNFKSNIFIRYNRIHRREQPDASNFDFIFEIERTEKQFRIAINYDENYFSDYFIEDLKTHLNYAIHQFRTLDIPLCSLEILPVSIKNKIIKNSFGERVGYDTSRTIQTLFEAQVKENPNNIALVFEGREFSYGSINDAANVIAYSLREQYDIRPNDLVSISLPRSEWLIIGILSILKSGAAYVPIDISYPIERIKHIISDTGTKVLITVSDHLFDFDYFEGTLLALDIQFDLKEANVSDLIPVNSDTDLAYLIYTSGSTGTPKGTPIQHRSILNTLLWQKEYYTLNADVVKLQLASYSFDSSVEDILGTLISGGTLVLPKDEARFSPLYLSGLIKQNQVSHLLITPSLYSILIKEITDSFNNVKAITLAGEEIHDKLLALHNELLPEVKLYNEYGPTENAVCSSACLLNNTEKVTIGKPISNVQMLILDEQLKLQPIGIAGQICVSGPGLSVGYWKRDDLTSQKFVPNPYSYDGQSKLYLTGDLGVLLPDGEIEFIGRKDQQLKIRGFRIEPGEIEYYLRLHADVTNTIVLTKEVEGEKQLIAFYTSDKVLDKVNLEEHLRKFLPSFMLPSYFLPIEKVPLNKNGKVDTTLLLGLVTVDVSDINAVEPVNPTEKALLAIWKDILGKNNIGITENFFSIGGHSLKAVQLSSRIYKELEVKIDITHIFDNPTIERLSKVVVNIDKTRFEEITPIEEQNYYSPSYAQRRLWIIDKLEQQKANYNVSSFYTFRGEFNKEAFISAFQYLVNRHESLRTTFISVKGEPKQKIHSYNSSGFMLQFMDLRKNSRKEQIAEGIANEEVRMPFDLEKGPLLRAKLISLEDDKFIFLFTVHHIISDGWSSEVLINEILEYYDLFAKKQEPRLPALKIQYKDFSAWQNRQLSGESFNKYKKYWLKQFEGEIPVLNIPTDYPRPAFKTYAGDRAFILLDNVQKEGVYALAQQNESTLFMAFIAIVNVLLYKYSHQQDIVLGTPIAGRNHPSLEDQIGIYLNSLAIRTQFLEEDSFNDLLQKVKTVTLEAFEHDIYPFDLLVDELNINRDLSRSPLFDVAVVLQNIEIKSEVNSMENVQVEDYKTDFRVSNLDLRIEFKEFDGGVQVNIDYNTGLFTKGSIERLLSQFNTIINTVINDSNRALKEIGYVTDTEKKQIIKQFNNTGCEFGSSQNVADMFREQALRFPDSIAVQFENEVFTYRELNEKSDLLAAYLNEKYDIRTNTVIGLMAEKSPKMVLGMLAIIKSGGIYLPVDPNNPKARRNYILSDAVVEILLTESTFIFDLEDYSGHLFALDLEEPVVNNISLPRVKKRSDDCAYIIYTSGSSGEPKGVPIREGSLTDRMQYFIQYLNITAEDKILQFASIGFDASLYEVFTALLSGATLVLFDYNARNNIPLFIELLEKYQISVMTLSPAYLKLLNKHPVPSVKKIISTGEAAIFEDALFYSQIKEYYNGYGPTETCVGASFYKVNNHDHSYYQKIQCIPIGRPFANTKIYIVDKDLNLMPIGLPGEICIAGIGLSKGYLNNQNLTTGKFVKNPFSDDESYRTMYLTGDMGKWNEAGEIIYCGRNDNQVQINGVRVELEEIASCILQHPDIQNAAILSNSDSSLVACVEEKKKVELWPDVNITNVFDNVLYMAMSNDELRINAFKNAFKKQLPGKIVLDVGTGQNALLAILAAEAGASKVYAVEINAEAAKIAKERIQSLGLENVIEVINEDIQTVTLKEQVDYCISDLSGNIGGAGGAALLINSSKRLMNEPANVFPKAYITSIAAISLPEEDFNYAFSEVPARYVNNIFNKIGYKFDLRICLKNFSVNSIISTEDTFEELDFTSTMPLNEEHHVRLHINKDADFNGFVLGLKVKIDDWVTVDNLNDGNTILPLFIPAFYPGIAVLKGDTFEGRIVRKPSNDNVHPDYFIQEGCLVRNSSIIANYSYSSFNHEKFYRNHTFYKKLFKDDEVSIKTELNADDIKKYLALKLPKHMIPNQVLVMEKLPISINGKIDSELLRKSISKENAVREIETPRNEVEECLAGIWKEVLEKDKIGINDNFFEIGGNSLRAIKALELMGNSFPATFEVTDLFSSPTISALSSIIKNKEASINEIEEIDF